MENVKNNKALPVAVATLAILLTGAVMSVSAQTPDDTQAAQVTQDLARHGGMKENREAFKASHEAVKAALEANDYDAWVAATAELPMAQEHADSINQETFNKMVEAHELMEEGDREGAKAIMEELGFQGMHRGHFGQRGEMLAGLKDQLTEDQLAQLKALKESNLPEEEMRNQTQALMKEFGVQMPERPLFAQLTEDQKTALEAVRNNEDLSQEEKMEQSKALMESYGIQAPKMERREFRQDLKQLTDEQKDALKAARESGDSEALKALMKDAGIQKPEGMPFKRFGQKDSTQDEK